VVEGGQVGAGEVVDVDVVAHAGAVGGRVVGAVDAHAGAQAQRGLAGDLHEVRVVRGRLADPRVGVGAGDVEVAQDREPEAGGRGDVPQDALRHHLGGPVGVDGGQRRRLRDHVDARGSP
jgi:hypothetical protein